MSPESWRKIEKGIGYLFLSFCVTAADRVTEMGLYFCMSCKETAAKHSKNNFALLSYLPVALVTEM